MDFHAVPDDPCILTKIHAEGRLGNVNEQDLATRFSDALVSEIKAEMGRQSLSSRALGRLIGKSSQYMSDRLDGGSPKTGRRTPLNALDLASISEALAVPLLVLIQRAEGVLSPAPTATVTSLSSRRSEKLDDDTAQDSADFEELPAAAFDDSKMVRRRDDEDFF